MAFARIHLFCLALVAVSTWLPTIHAATFAPPDGQALFGAWLDTTPTDAANPNTTALDSPSRFNQRLGFNASFFQFAQNLPIDPNKVPPLFHLLDTDTDAMLYLTVYPDASLVRNWKSYDAFDLLNATVINDFVTQISGYVASYKLRILLRLMPEMNGNWMPYGQRPARYVQTWRAIHDAFRAANLLDSVSFVWAPSTGLNYPYGGFQSTSFTSTPYTNASILPAQIAEFPVLDSNSDGVFNNQDDPYLPYYPGDEYTDWVGMSLYYFGHTFPWLLNELPRSDDPVSLLSAGTSNILAIAPSKPFFITETNPAFFLTQTQGTDGTALSPPRAIAAGPGQTALKQAWWKDYLTSSAFHAAYPRIKAYCLFEFQKNEEITFRDFEITNATTDGGAVLAAFKADFAATGNYFVSANYSTSVQNTSGTIPSDTDAKRPSGSDKSSSASSYPIDRLGAAISVVAGAAAILAL